MGLGWAGGGAGQKEGVYSVGFVQTGLGEIIQCTDGALLGKGWGGAGRG